MLIQRTIKICSDKKFLDEELDIIKHNLCEVKNNPRKSVQNVINYHFTQMKQYNSNLNEGNNSKEIFSNLKYAGQKREQLMSIMKKKQSVIH